MRGAAASGERPQADPPAPAASGAHEPTDPSRLARESVRGGALSFAAQGATALVGLASTAVLARLLSPDDYGLLAMVVAVTSFAALFRDLGLSSAAVQQRSLTGAQQSNLFWVNVAVGGALTLAVASAAPLVSRFYGRPELLWVTVALSTSFLIGGVATQSGALLVRDMRFGRHAAATVCGALVTFTVALGLASRGLGYWSLVWGQLAGGAATSALLLALSSFRPGRPRRETGLRRMLAFGASVTAFDVVNYVHRNLDNLLIGRYWGAAPLGIYSRAYALLMFPILNVRGPINAVAFPVLSRLQHDPAAFRAYYLRVTSVLASISMPLTAYLYAASEPVVELVLGGRWLGVVPVFSWLAVAGFVQPTSGFSGSLMLSLGRARAYLARGLFNTAVVGAGFVAGLPWGPTGVAASYAVTAYLVLYPSLRWSYRDSPVSVRDFVRACAFPAAASVAAAAVAIAVRPRLAHLGPVLQLGSLAMVFAAVISCAAALTAAGRAQVAFLARVAAELKGSPARPR
jgi:PST family polysaccharide transporter